MQPHDIERILMNTKFVHLTEDELGTYCDGRLDEITFARANAHLKLCLICERRLAILQEDKEAVAHEEVTADDIALVDQLLPHRPSRDAVRMLVQLHVLAFITFAAMRLARTRWGRPKFWAGAKLYASWPREAGAKCILSEDERGFVFTVDTIDASQNGTLLRFTLVDQDTKEKHVMGLLVLHPDPLNEGHYVASARLPDDVTLPEHCQPCLDTVVNLNVVQPSDLDVLRVMVSAAAEEADRQAWREWVERERRAGRLAKAVADAICQACA